jgi:hypothetical protein
VEIREFGTNEGINSTFLVFWLKLGYNSRNITRIIHEVINSKISKG